MPLIVGEPAPTFRAPNASNPIYAVDTAAGRYVVFAVLSGADEASIKAGAALLEEHRRRFDDVHACAFGIVPDTPRWRKAGRDLIPGVRFLFDRDGEIARLYEAEDAARWVLCDPTLRILRMTGDDQAASLLENVSSLPDPDLHAGAPGFAPVLLVPRVFEPEFCQRLIRHYDEVGGEPSGFMREIDGVTRLMSDENHKKRSDVHLHEDGELKVQARARVLRRLLPQIRAAFQFNPTRMERYLVACYDGSTGGYFRPHRDNTTKGTAHLRFAVSINLNADFDGGDLRFPEYGRRTYRPPVGGAVVFSCSLLHEATPVKRGRRYAFLPFLYDEAAARIREENIGFLDPALIAAHEAEAPVEA